MSRDERAPVLTEFFSFKGGLDITSTPIDVAAGRLLDCVNYEPDIHGGYSRCLGYERFDGRPSPSEARYTALACTLTQTLTPGDALVAGTLSGTFVRVITGGILLTDTTGNPQANVNLMRGATQVGGVGNNPFTALPITAEVDAGYLVDAADYRRAAIGQVPGSGPVRSVWALNGQVFAVRDNVGGTTGVLYKATSTGWQAIAMPRELGFTAGALVINAGETVKGMTSNATGVVRRVCVEAGEWGAAGAGAARGRLIIDTVTGVFQTGEALRSSVDTYTATRATSTSPIAVPVTMSPGGTYEWLNTNFYGQRESLRAYCVNGLDRAFEFDGTTVAPINTGATVDRPQAVAAVNSTLWLGQGSSAMYSEAGEPHRWQALNGAGEIAFGDTVTALQSLPGQALGVFMRNSTSAVVGASPSNFEVQVVAADVGALPRTVVALDDTYWWDDRGITSAYTSKNYGNFEFATCSRHVQPLVNALRGRPVATVVVRAKNQYRAICNDGRVMVMHVEVAKQGPGSQRPITMLRYDFNPSCACSVEDAQGVERIFAGSTSGYVYELERGSTFDGAEIEAFARIWYHNSKTPTLRKRYRRVTLEMVTTLFTRFRLFCDYSYGDEGSLTFLRDDVDVAGFGGIWEVGNWEEMFYDAESYASPTLSLTGTGTNVSLLIYSKSRLDFGHRLQGAILHYSNRRIQRS